MKRNERNKKRKRQNKCIVYQGKVMEGKPRKKKGIVQIHSFTQKRRYEGFEGPVAYSR